MPNPRIRVPSSKSLSVGSGPSPLAAADALREVLSACRDYAAIRQSNLLRRQEIASEERVALARIDAQRQLLMAYLDRAFGERSDNFRLLFEALDASRRAADAEAVSQTLAGIIELARSSPLADLVNLASVQQRLSDPNHEWTI
jgi:hypothetical protein